MCLPEILITECRLVELHVPTSHRSLGLNPDLRSLAATQAKRAATSDLRPVYSDTTQLNSTRRRVELRRRSVYSDADATQLNSTDLLRADWLYAANGSVALPIVGDS